MDNRTYVEIRYGPLMKFMEVYNYTNEEEAILDYIQKIGIQGLNKWKKQSLCFGYIMN